MIVFPGKLHWSGRSNPRVWLARRSDAPSLGGGGDALVAGSLEGKPFTAGNDATKASHSPGGDGASPLLF